MVFVMRYKVHTDLLDSVFPQSVSMESTECAGPWQAGISG